MKYGERDALRPLLLIAPAGPTLGANGPRVLPGQILAFHRKSCLFARVASWQSSEVRTGLHHEAQRITLWVVGIGIWGALGCVPKAKYVALQSSLADQNKQCSQDVQEADARTEQVRAELLAARETAAAERSTNESLAQKVDAQGSELESLQAELTASQQKLADILHDRVKLEASAAQMRAALDAARKREQEVAARVADYRRLLLRFRPLIDAGKLDVRIVDGRMVLTLPMDVLFRTGSSKLSPEGKDAIIEVGHALESADLSRRRFQVEGHTDNVPIRTATFRNNWELSAARALVVVETLLEAGVAANALSGAGFGEYQPRADNRTAEGRALNRRIEIVVLPDLDELPGREELEAIARESKSP